MNMRKFKISISCIALAMLTLNSCKKKEEATVTNDNTSSVATNTGDENKKLSVTELSSGVKIVGSTEKTGTPPAPNSQLDFQMTTDSDQGIRNEGFDIKFASNEQIAGAYIRFADVDGNKVDGYIDVPVSLGSERSARNVDTKSKDNRALRLSATDSTSSSAYEYEIDVDFEKTLTPGRFCYFICLYNASGQISPIQERCVTVEEWGGDSKIVGAWKFTKFSDDSDEYSYYIPCESGDSVLVTDSLLVNDWVLTIYDNGTYKEQFVTESYEANYDSSYSTCTPQLENTVSKYDEIYKGNWAYDSENNTFTAIDYEVIDNLDPSESEVYDEGDLYLDRVPVIINGNELQLQNIDGENSVTAYFTKQ